MIASMKQELKRNEFTARSSASSMPALVLLSVLMPVTAVAQVYVSPKGSDEANGSRARPVQTLDHARTLARSGTRRVLLDDGVYRLTAPLMISPEDSGVSFAALPGAHPVVSGGVQVTGWAQVDAKHNLWRAPAPRGLTNTRQMYVDGRRVQRAKGRLPVRLTMTATGYTSSDGTMSHWKNVGDIEFVYTGGNTVWSEHSEGLGSWTEPRCPVASIEGTTITMAQPCWDNSTKRVMLPSKVREANLVGPKSVGKEPAYVENAFELLGTPGEWYFDRPGSSIYYVPRAGEDMVHADVEMPVLETLVAISGTTARPVHDVTFSGVQFAYATWLGPSNGTGFSEIQANYMVTGVDGYAKQGLCTLVPGGECPYGNWTRTPGNVSVRGGRGIRFLKDDFVHLGAAGLDLGEGTQNSVVEECVFTDISGNGVQLGGVSAPLAPAAEFTADNRIENDVFRNVGAEYRGGIGIVVGYAARTTIAHNELDHLPYAGISIGWGGWPDKIKLPGEANNSSRNMIAANRIHDFMLVLSDGGGIYTQGRTGKDLSDGEQVTGNVIYNQYSSGHGIYTDNGSAMITMRQNVLFRTNHDNLNSRHRDYYDAQSGENFNPLVIEENWWQQGDPDSDKAQVRVKGNRIIASLTDAPATLLAEAGLQAKFKPIAERRFSAVGAPDAPSRVAAYGLNGTADITWSPPTEDGGDAVDSYTVVSSGGQRVSVPAKEFLEKAYVKMDGLKNGQEYSFTVSAANGHGVSPASLPSRSVTVRERVVEKPAIPGSVAAFLDHGKVSIHFQTPASSLPKDDEAPIIAYVVTVHPGERKVYFTGRNVIALQDSKHVTFGVIDGLTSGAELSFSISAVNAAGEGDPATVTAIPVSQ
jgi:hypothetical protein